MPRVACHAGRSRATEAGFRLNGKPGVLGKATAPPASVGQAEHRADGVLVEPPACEQPGRAPDRRLVVRRRAEPVGDPLARSLRVTLGMRLDDRARGVLLEAVALEVGPCTQMPVAAPPQLIAERDGER